MTQFLWEHSSQTKRALRGFGKVPRELEDKAEDTFIHSARSPESIVLVVSGANNNTPRSLVS